MMTVHSRVEQYLTAADAVLADIERIPVSERNTPGVCGHWTLKDMLGHLAFWDGFIIEELDASAAGAQHPGVTEPFDVINARESGKQADRSWDEVMAELMANRERLLPLLVDPGETDAYRIYQHWEEHGEQIAGFVARVEVQEGAARA